MNKTLICIAAAAALALTGCDSSQRLADNMAGSWSGAPEHLADNSAATASIIPTFDFTLSDGTQGGDVILSSIVNVTVALPANEDIVEPFSVSAAATASISGTWTAVSDEDVTLTWDPQSLKVDVDPDAVTLSSDLLSGREFPTVDSLKPRMAESLRAQIAKAVEVKFLSMKRIEDIKFHSNIMKCEINDVDLHMERQTR